MKVSELEGADLDAAVALALGYQHLGAVGVNYRNTEGKPFCLSGCNDWWHSPGDADKRNGGFICAGCYSFPNAYSSDWQHGGPIVERERIAVVASQSDDEPIAWSAVSGAFDGYIDEILPFPEYSPQNSAMGQSPLIAAMRAFVRGKLGDEVDLAPASGARVGDGEGV